MAQDKYQTMGDGIYAHIGGPQNVAKLIHCMTRVRLTIKDEAKVDQAALKKVPGVLGVVQEETLQVIVGPGTVNKVAQAMVDRVGAALGDPFPANTQPPAESNQSAVEAKAAEVRAAHKAKLKQTWWRAALKHISAIFIPLIPAFVGAGLISGVAGILANLLTAGDLPTSWASFITVLKVINGGLFTFLNIYVGINAATEFGATAGLGGIIGGLVYLPGVVAPITINNVFTHQPLSPGQGGIIGVIFAVWLLAVVEKRLHRLIPDAIDIIFTPMLSLLSIGLLTIFFIMPLAGWVSSSLVGTINWTLQVGGAFSGAILGLAFLPMVMLGLHQILTPIHLEMIKSIGYTGLLPILAMAGGGQVGAALALWIKCRQNQQLVRLIKGALPVGILGVGEPLIYGVSLPLGRPFVTACIGGGIGGAVIGMIGHIGAITIGPSGAALIPLIANHQWLGYVFGLLASYAGGFLATYFFGVPESAMVPTSADGTIIEPLAVTTAAVPETPSTRAASPDATQFVAPAAGQLQALSEVPDDVFSQKMVGDGFAIVPSHGTVVAPVDGTIVSIMPTKHAWTMTTATGLEILVHMGLDTVALNGDPFTVHVTENETVKAGQQIAEMDLPAIKTAGKSTTIITVITNMTHVTAMTSFTDQSITAGEDVLRVTSQSES
ncbi:glucose PTS transporter subunit IIA [Lacticaseibacillus paracasei]|uniref:glucose PTS transporter subunit IIA n=1 Tax=Lacticaseibacillus paracasei TaxID=1597 RepID=UPI00272C28C5|nr:glucose PTS transporter subunit IIA [Lacticaseibacillus paracasei]WKZ96294.1 glucose PTS transporter subunit IIA [Lacticaseibacillus paracasei]